MPEKSKLSEYNGTFDACIIEKMHSAPQEIDIETMKKCLYGYTYAEEYAEYNIPDELSMDYWEEEFYMIPSPTSFDLADPFGELSEFTDDSDNDITDSDSYEDDLDPYIVSTPQEKLLLRAIDSTGDGKTPETALCVIDVHQEYEYINRVFDYMGLTVKRQSLLEGGIDRIEFEDNDDNIKDIYFNISCRFKAGHH